VTTPIPHWPGRMITLLGGEEVWLAETPDSGASAKDLVLCVHGMSGSATNWTDLMAELAPDFDCAAVDLPGSGFSPPPRTGAGYRVSALAGTVTRLIETLGAGPVHLVGNSMGGAVSVRVAARRPDLVKTLTLISPALPDRKVRGSVAHFPVLALPFAGEWLVRHYSARFPVENRVAGVYATCFYDAARLHPDRFALEVEALRRRDELSYEATSLARAARTLVLETFRPGTCSLWRAARRVTAPSLVLFGSHDRLVDPRLAARAAGTFRDARVEVLPETGHLAQMECPGLVAALFREMVGETRARGAASSEATQVPG
jgi:pimeloyl-ACP methyl ester carboxylesterase